jgi:hypothetical protein
LQNYPEHPEAVAIEERVPVDGVMALYEANRVKLESFSRLLPYDGEVSLPGPWALWHQQIKGIADAAAALQRAQVTLLLARGDPVLTGAEIERIRNWLAKLEPLLPYDGVVGLPGPWELWCQMIKGLGKLACALEEARLQLMLDIGDRGALLVERERLTQRVAALNRYVPWDGTAPLPGPWEFWYQMTKAVHKYYGQLQINLATLTAKGY